jgi:large subunit ribosomal protein L18e
MIVKRKIAERAKRKTNLQLKKLLLKLKKSNSDFWINVAKLLARPRRKFVEVNLDKIEKNCEDEDVVLVPGKVLGKGVLSKKITLACFKISKGAKNKIEFSKSRLMSIDELYEKDKEGKNIKLIT